MTARVRLVMTLAATVTCTALEPEAATPPAKPRMSASVRAFRVRAAPVVNVEPEILARTALVMTLAPTIAETALLPDAAMLSPSARIEESSEAESVA